jgi:hypothetical protein
VYENRMADPWGVAWGTVAGSAWAIVTQAAARR